MHTAHSKKIVYTGLTFHPVHNALCRLFNRASRAPRAARSASTPTAKRIKQTKMKETRMLGSTPGVVGLESAPGMIRMLSTPSASEENADKEQVERILDAGSNKLFSSEEGREKVRDSAYDPGKTAEVMLEAAEESLSESGQARDKEDAGKAHVSF